MKNIVLILITILFSQIAQSQKNSDSYKTLWEKVHKLENDVLTTSALKVAQEISEKAKKENNSVQLVKSLLFTSKYVLILEEGSQLKIVNGFKAEIEKGRWRMQMRP